MEITISLKGARIVLTEEQNKQIAKFVQSMLFGRSTSKPKLLGSRRWAKRELRAIRKMKADNNGKVPSEVINKMAVYLGRTRSAIKNKLSITK